MTEATKPMSEKERAERLATIRRVYSHRFGPDCAAPGKVPECDTAWLLSEVERLEKELAEADGMAEHAD